MHVVAVLFYTGYERSYFDDRMEALEYAERMRDLGFQVFVYHP